MLSVLSSVNAIQPIAPSYIFACTPLRRIIDQARRNGWPTISMPVGSKFSGRCAIRKLSKGLNIDKQPGDYAITRYYEGAWQHVSRFYSQDGTWLADYAGLTTPIAIFSDHIDLFDLQVAVVRSPTQAPEIVGMEALNRLHTEKLVTTALVDKVREESEAIAQQWRDEAE